MASSLLHSSVPLIHHHSATSNSSSGKTCFLLGMTRTQNFSDATKSGGSKSFANRRGHVWCSGLDEVSELDPSETEKSKAEFIGSLKLKLLSAVSGLNRGLTANEDDLRKAGAAAKELVYVAGPIDVQAEIDKLQGRWKPSWSPHWKASSYNSWPGIPKD